MTTAISTNPSTMFINAPAATIIILCQTGFLLSARSSSTSSSSPTMLTKPPIGIRRREYLTPSFPIFETSFGPMPMANSSMPTLKSLANMKCPSSWIRIIIPNTKIPRRMYKNVINKLPPLRKHCPYIQTYAFQVQKSRNINTILKKYLLTFIIILSHDFI